MKQFFLVTLIVMSCFIAADGAWIHSLEDAKTKAKAENKDILLYFTGSDWCSWCVVLHREVFDTEVWQKEAEKKFVWVKLDFPRFTPIAPEQKEYNEKIAEEFSVQGFPSVFFLDAEGLPYASTGYQAGGAEKYLEHVEELEKQKAVRDSLMAKYLSVSTDLSASKEVKAAALGEVLAKLEEWELAGSYVGLKEDLLGLEEDKERKFAYASELAAHFQTSDPEKSKKYLALAIEIKPEEKTNIELRVTHLPKIETDLLNQGKWKEALETCKALMNDQVSGEPGKMLYYFAAVAEANLQNWDGAIAYTEKAISFPGGPPEADMQLNQVLGYLRHQKDQLGAASTEPAEASTEETIPEESASSEETGEETVEEKTASEPVEEKAVEEDAGEESSEVSETAEEKK